MTDSPSSRPDPLESLVVFDRMEIGPVKVEPRRLVTPYRLFFDGKEDKIDLIYSYEEKVFDPQNPVSINLAGMVGAQVAFNYGLFCKTIVFHGIFDNADRSFIRDMMENTAREILVKKILDPTPFLKGDALGIPTPKKDRYLYARLEFPDEHNHRRTDRWAPWEVERDRYVVLSSGGKDSLLSYGLMNEMDRDVHPVFINESGRHWFTALNGYNYFKANVPNTARVWSNCDRIYNWVLRHMPFIRQDFASVRSDEYPIRLWTVAVFLFGAIPLMRKRKIARLIIGDEFDTTRKLNYRGITHYDGLYDQSRYFDDALSRYYRRKGWNISQFSIVRPLSELLIQDILTHRYPHLQEHQVSCHAAHKEEDRIHPCGLCEKCHRIVGMVKALGADPTRCGYSDKQIQHIMETITVKGVHQESAGVQQLMLMLVEKELVKLPASVKRHLKPHPEVRKLRFDPEHAPIDGIPVELRPFLYRIFLEYAHGAVRRAGRQWQEFDVMAAPLLQAPYPFDAVPAAGSRSKKINTNK
jgi:hypothetical protein